MRSLRPGPPQEARKGAPVAQTVPRAMLLDVSCALVLGALGATVAIRMARGVAATYIVPVETVPPVGAISVIVPVLDEAERIASCLRGLLSAGPEVGEILVVDGGSRDETVKVVLELAADDPRVRVFSTAPVPPGWNGKAWGLDVGLRSTNIAA